MASLRFDSAGVEAGGVGRDLLAGPLPADRPIVGEYYYPKQFIGYFPEEERDGPLLAPYLREIRSLRVGGHKLIWGSDYRSVTAPLFLQGSFSISGFPFPR